MVTVKVFDPPVYVKYTGASKDQIQWGGNDDPRGYLAIGAIYTLREEIVHSYHTKYRLDEFPTKLYNSVSFEHVDEDDVK